MDMSIENINAVARLTQPFEEYIRVRFWRFHDPRNFHSRMVMKPTWEEVKDATVMSDDFGVIIGKTSAQQLMDTLWECGIRPTEGKGSAGAMSAVQAHLKDLQGINDRLFGMLDRPLLEVKTLEARK